MNNTEQRIIRLEEMISLQQQEILHISKELYAQHQQNQQQTEQIMALSRRLKEALGNQNSNIRPIEEETPPPHY